MELRRILNNKVAAIVGGFFAIGYLFPALTTDTETVIWDFKGILAGLIWLWAAIFVWKKYKWAVIIMLLLALYDLIFDIILEIPGFWTVVDEYSKKFDLAKSTIQVLAVAIFSLEALILLYVIFFGLAALREKG